MTDDQHAMLTTYVNDLRKALGLRDWTVTVKHRPSTEDASAQVHCIYGQRLAHIRVAEDWWDDSPDDQRSHIVHELLHCHLDPTDTLVCSLEGTLGGGAFAIAHSAHETAVEFAVDGITRAVAPLLPLPAWAHNEERIAP